MSVGKNMTFLLPCKIVSNWRGYARRVGISNADMEQMSLAFKV